MYTGYVDYTDGGLTCQAFVAYDDSSTEKRPCVLISHAFSGQTDFERDKAVKLAGLGYVGFALDLYGKGVRGGSPEESSRLMRPFLDDRLLLRRRILAGVAAARSHPIVDADRIGAIGFCFGGLCVLDLARSAEPAVRGVVSFHGLLHPAGLEPRKPVTAKVLILHGYDDPMAKPDQMLAVAQEFTEAGADWQIHAYGHTKHAFTNPKANDPQGGKQYNAASDRRSWKTMQDFLAEALNLP